MTVDRADPSRLKVEWDEVRTHEDRIAEQAHMIAAQMNGGGASAATTSSISCARRSRAREITVSSHTAEPGGPDRRRLVERLERLAALHRSAR